jgi:hypothetical protein
MSGPLTILNRVRERVIAGDWRNHLVAKEDEWCGPGPGCILQLFVQEGGKDTDSHYGLYDLLPDASLIQWNDDPARTPQDVIDLLDRAIALALKDNS